MPFELVMWNTALFMFAIVNVAAWLWAKQRLQLRVAVLPAKVQLLAVASGILSKLKSGPLKIAPPNPEAVFPVNALLLIANEDPEITPPLETAPPVDALLSVNVQPSTVACGQELAINRRDGPVESTAVVGCYHLTGSFGIGVTQGKGVFHRQAAVADFDPAPQLDAFWADVLKPFRAVPRQEFGFKLVLRVIEEPAT